MDNRKRIIEEAASMFRTYGIRAVTMDMLANQIGISKRTIYEIFRDKEELLDGVLKWMTLKQMELTKINLEKSENVIEAIFRIMDNMLEHYKKMSPAFRLDIRKYHFEIAKKFQENGELPYSSSRDMLVRGVKEGIFRKDIDLDLTNKCLTGVTRMPGNDQLLPSGMESEEVLRDFFINYLRGISTSKGLDLINFYERKRTERNKQDLTESE